MGDRRLNRIDRVAHIDVGDKAELPTPGHAPARRTREGYLEVDALIARDGLLKYSDGRESWVEYRPRAELEKAAATWAGTPVTDDHPSDMVNAKTWAAVSKGVHLGAPSVEVHDGVAYLRSRLLITDAALIAKIDGGQRELSIGFTAAVEPTIDGVASDGTRCDAIQSGMFGNHTASVTRGRAGPACRVLMDSASCDYGDIMKIEKPKVDEVGSPVEQVEVVGPDGMPVLVPTWIAAALERLMELEAPSAPAPEAEAEAEAAPLEESASAPAPAAPAAPAVSPELVAAVAAELRKAAPSKDSLNAVRRKIDRLALAHNLVCDKFDELDLESQARQVLTKRGVRCDSYSSEQLAALVDVEASRPTADARPWADAVAPVPVAVSAKVDSVAEAAAKFLKDQGY